MQDRAMQDRRVKTALDETRLLILGAQILFGFHLNGAFQKGFDALDQSARALHAAAFVLMAMTIALLIAPSLQHRIADRGYATPRIVRAASRYASLALLPFALALGADIGIVLGLRFGRVAGSMAGIAFAVLALIAWYGAAWVVREKFDVEESMQVFSKTPIETRVEHMLTEARVLLPGAQAMLGFQLAVMLTETFAQLPAFARRLHAAALLATALAVILLMAPAAFHRIAFKGNSTETFHRIGSALVMAAAAPLALGIVFEMYVAVLRAVESDGWAWAAAGFVLLVLAGLWLALPLFIRASEGRDGQEEPRRLNLE
jgi:hypothetical protein